MKTLLTAFLVSAALSTPLAQNQDGPPEGLRTRIRGFIEAINTADRATFLKLTADAFTPELTKSRTADEHWAFVTRIRSEFGTIKATTVQRDGPSAPLMIAIEGAKGVKGTLELDVEDGDPYRITSLGIDVR
jgi:hypothetical protein